MFNGVRSREIPTTVGTMRYPAVREKSATTAREFKSLFKTPTAAAIDLGSR